jgi:hypothetical protein
VTRLEAVEEINVQGAGGDGKMVEAKKSRWR